MPAVRSIQVSMFVACLAMTLGATVPGFAQTWIFNEIWDTNYPGTPQALPAPSGTFQADHFWNYTVDATGGQYQWMSVALPMGSTALAQTAVGSSFNSNTFYSLEAPDNRIGDVGAVVVAARFQFSATGNNGSRQTSVGYAASDGSIYSIASNGRIDQNPDFSVFVMTNELSVPDGLRTIRASTDYYDMTTTFTKQGTVTRVDYVIFETSATTQLYASGTSNRPIVLGDDVVLDRAQIVCNYRTLCAVDNIAIGTIPPVPVPIIQVPATVNIHAPAGATVESTVTIANLGTGPLTVTSCSIVQQSSPGAFAIVAGGLPPADTVTTPGGVHPTHDVVFSFNNTLGISDPPASATVQIESDHLGNADPPGYLSVVTLYGYRSDVFTWVTDAQAYWTTDTAWTPQGIPAREDTAIIGSGITSRTTTLAVDPATGTRDNGITSLSLTGGELHVLNNNFRVGNSAGCDCLFVLDGGLLHSQNSVQLGQAANSTGRLDIRKGTVQTNGNMAIANANPSTGVVTMSGGTMEMLDAGFDVILGNAANAYARWTMTGGVIHDQRSMILGGGAGANGAFMLSGGTVNITGTQGCALANAANAVGAIDVAGGEFNVPNGSVYVGNVADSTGSIHISGGVVNVANDLDIALGSGAIGIGGAADVRIGANLVFGTAASGHGSFNMAGGKLTASAIQAYATGNPVDSWSWTSGTIIVSNVSLPVEMTNNGGTLSPGGGAIGTTIFSAATTYTQTAGSVDIHLGDFGVNDQIVLTSATANLLGGSIDVTLDGPEPATGGSWDIIAATGSGSVNAGAVAFNLPGPAPCWTVTSTSQKVTVEFHKPPTLLLIPATTATLLIDLSTGLTTASKDITMQNVGEFDLTISSVTVSGTSFTLLQPAALPLLLAPTSASVATVAFDSQGAIGTYYGALAFEGDAENIPLALGLRADVVEAILPASGIEFWVRY